MKKPLLFLPTFVAALAALPAMAPSPAQSDAQSADAIMHRIELRNSSLESFQTRVHVNLRMVSFPWFRSKLDGTEYYKKPDKEGVVFDNPPSYAHGIASLFGAIDSPSGWRKDSNVAYAGTKTMDGKPMLTLRMTKKIYSDQIKDTIAYVDPASYQVARMDFDYLNGDVIVMTQTYRDQGGFSVVAARHLEIRRRVRAVADASYTTYQTNVAINDAVFKQQQK